MRSSLYREFRSSSSKLRVFVECKDQEDKIKVINTCAINRFNNSGGFVS